MRGQVKTCEVSVEAAEKITQEMERIGNKRGKKEGCTLLLDGIAMSLCRSQSDMID